VFDNFAKTNAGPFSFQILRGLHLEKISGLMLNSDFAFISAGITMWEAMKLGLPFHAIALTGDQYSYLQLMESQNLWFGHTQHMDLDQDLILEILNSYFAKPHIALKLLGRYATLEIGSEIEQLLSQFLGKGEMIAKV
jgi:spore coat polysaccharide biosynthesis predicted glycosyltransferase SpsG